MDSQLLLTAEEREHLVELLREVVKDARVEEHRTRSSAYREHISRREDALSAVPEKAAGFVGRQVVSTRFGDRLSRPPSRHYPIGNPSPQPR